MPKVQQDAEKRILNGKWKMGNGKTLYACHLPFAIFHQAVFFQRPGRAKSPMPIPVHLMIRSPDGTGGVEVDEPRRRRITPREWLTTYSSLLASIPKELMFPSTFVPPSSDV
jgi:hypothetical protein